MLPNTCTAPILFLLWVTFAEHKWVVLGERRRRPGGLPPYVRTHDSSLIRTSTVRTGLPSIASSWCYLF